VNMNILTDGLIYNSCDPGFVEGGADGFRHFETRDWCGMREVAPQFEIYQP
jgi:hypothetical protein